jgi:hypothetical protein
VEAYEGHRAKQLAAVTLADLKADLDFKADLYVLDAF